MRIIIFLLFTFLLSQPVLSQPPNKAQAQAKMQEAKNNISNKVADLEKQIATAKKENPEKVKGLEEKRAMLKQQLTMMEGLNKNVANMSEKTIQQAAEAEDQKNSIPKKDVARINALPKKILNDAELVSFVRTVHTEVEKTIPAAEKTEALEIYNETKAKYNSPYATGTAASGCWMLSHWEKALYIMGKACMDDMTDPDNLNNYAAFLTMTGGEQAALPILQYLNNKYPENSTILNNIGQAWYGLGDINNTKKWLDSAILIYPTHSQANLTLSKIYRSENDSARAIAALKRSLSETYDSEKEAELIQLGGELEFDDLPEFTYPLEADDTDPLGFIPFFDALPAYPSSVDESHIANNKTRATINAVREERRKNGEIVTDLSKKMKTFMLKLGSNSNYSKTLLLGHNTPQHKLANVTLLKWKKEQLKKKSGAIAAKKIMPLTEVEILDICTKQYQQEVLIPRNAALAATNLVLKEIAKKYEDCAGEGSTCGNDWRERWCDEANAATNTYLKKSAELEEIGKNIFKSTIKKHGKALKEYIKLNTYAMLDDTYKVQEEQSVGVLHERAIGESLELYKSYETFLKLYYSLLQSHPEICLVKVEQTEGSDPDELAHLVYFKEPKCSFKKVIKAEVFTLELKCATLRYLNGRIADKKGNIQKGTGQSSKRRNQNRGPLHNRSGGPSSSFIVFDIYENIFQKSGPLTAEEKDPSQLSIEYDRWGNIIGLKLQLNEEGTELADPDSQETGVDSRWSWDAAGSAQKGFLNRVKINPPLSGARTPKTEFIKVPGKEILINRPGPKSDSVKTVNPYDFSNVEICFDILSQGNLPPRSPGLTSPSIPKINQDGELEEPASIKQALTGFTEKMWDPGNVITVGFYATPGKNWLIDTVKKYAKDRESIANIKFDFINDVKKVQVKVGFGNNSSTSGSKLGRDILLAQANDTTMKFGLLNIPVDSKNFKVTIRHELGHTLGFIHEHQAPGAGISWDKEKVYALYEKYPARWSRADVDVQIFDKYSRTNANSSSCDKYSIMHYYFSSSLTTDSTSFSQNNVFSSTDSAYSKLIYPFPPSPQNAAGILRTKDDCDEIDFLVEYNAIDPNLIEFILESGRDHNNKLIT